MENLNFVGKRYWFIGGSLILIVIGMIALALFGLPLGIDFKGGARLEIQLPGATGLNTNTINTLLNDKGLKDAIVQLSKSDTNLADNDLVIIRSAEMNDATKTEIARALGEQFGITPNIFSFESVGPTVGQEVTWRAVGAVMIAALGIMLYISFAFRGVPNALRYGIAAIVALLHDVLIMLSATAILSKLFGWQVDALFLTATLTVIGFSVHDSIVVFDRLRENLSRTPKADYELVTNRSVLQSLSRSINTQLTAVFALLAVVLFGGTTLRHFVITMMIGMISGTYSSVCIAAPLLVIWQKREWQHWFGKKEKTA
jgi:preprotein translocase subunit SecF